MQWNKSSLYLILFVLFIGLVSSWTPPSTIDGMNFYNITNFTVVNATNLYGDGSGLTGVSVSTSNRSEYWGDLGNSSEITILSTITTGVWNGTAIVDLYLSTLNASKLFNEAYLNSLILVEWDNVTGKATHLSNFTDNLNYSTKNTNSSDFWDALDTPSDLTNKTIVDWDNVTNKLFTSVEDYYIYINSGGFVLRFNETRLNSTIETLSPPVDYSVLVYWANISDPITHQSNLTDDTDYSTKDTNSSSFWDWLDGPLNLTNLTIVDWANITNKFITAVDNYYLYMSGTTMNVNLTAFNDSFQTSMKNVCGPSDFATGVLANGSLNCSTPAGGGDITEVNTNGQYLEGGETTGAVNLIVNETILNGTINDLASPAVDYGVLVYWINISDPLTHLGNFTDNLGDRGYTDLANFSDSVGYMTDVSNDTSPSLGGDLNASNNNITDIDSVMLENPAARIYWNGTSIVITDGTTVLSVGG